MGHTEKCETETVLLKLLERHVATRETVSLLQQSIRKLENLYVISIGMRLVILALGDQHVSMDGRSPTKLWSASGEVCDKRN